MIFDRISTLVWDRPVDAKPFFVKWPLLTLRLAFAVVRDLQDGSLGLRATSLVYTTLLSLAPLLAVSFSVLKGFGVHNQIEPSLRMFLSPLGPQADDITANIIGFVENINIGVLGTLGVTMLLYGVLSLMQKIETAFNDIWNVPVTRPFAERIRDYFCVLMIGPLFIFLSVGLTASFQYAAFLQALFHIDLAGAIDTVLRFVPWILFAMAFTALYMFMPNTRVRFMPALVAGFVTGGLWKILGVLFGVFVTGSGSYAAIYSAFTALILFIIWIYVGWLTVLIGASVSYYLQHPSNQRLSRRFRHLSLRVKEKLALMIIAEIGRAFYNRETPRSVHDLAQRMRIPARAVDDVTEDLTVAGVLVETENGFVPGKPFDTTSVYDTLQQLRAADEEGGISFGHLHSSATTDRILDLSEKASRVVLGNITLKQLCFGEVNA